ncbi:MAG: hypothetical protein ABI233_02015 [Chthoniobacterales bacterium]
MSASIYAQPHGDLLFHWERPRRRRVAIAGFLLASLGLHLLCFLLFQVIYPPTISLLPPPARVSVIAPTSEEARNFLHRLAAEDPALISETQRPAEARRYQLPRLEHVPSYIAVPPSLKQLPPLPPEVIERSSMPPGPVPMETPIAEPPPVHVPTTISFSGALKERAFTSPPLSFHASQREAPQDVQFRVGVDRSGIVRYCLLATSSGEAALDEQARRALTLCRFQAPVAPLLPNDKLTWAIATVNFGTDLKMPPPVETAP